MTTQINPDSGHFTRYSKPVLETSLCNLSKSTSVTCGKRTREKDSEEFAVPMVLKRAKKSEESNNSEEIAHSALDAIQL